MEANPMTDAESTPRKFIQFDLNTAAITDLATKFLKPEKLIPLLQEHNSVIIVAALWLTLHIRSWLSVLPLPIPSLATLPLVLLTLVSLSLITPARTLTGLAYHTYTEISSSITSLTQKILPAWLPRAIPIVLLFSITRAITILLVLAVSEILKKYRKGVVGVTEEADQAIHRAVSAAGKAGELVREAKGLEMQAMQLAAAVVDDDNETARATVTAAREVKTEVEGIVKEVEVLGAKVDKVRELAERAKAVAEEGDLELAEEMVVNVGKLVERAVQGGEKVREKLEGVRGRLWGLSLGESSGYCSFESECPRPT
ncbi:hypothetical protein DL764_000242 [Monosporascus ibericus]|uniref:Uncharacterized protein n=1 Tax=Monosporascus ibericus TaxID=155417 RepID=A0A4Q4TWU2_9PEZI|nr:hypothetical protein DL764_000242 [Monosporascus ibericus]